MRQKLVGQENAAENIADICDTAYRFRPPEVSPMPHTMCRPGLKRKELGPDRRKRHTQR